MRIGNLGGRAVLIDQGADASEALSTLRAADLASASGGRFTTFADIIADQAGFAEFVADGPQLDFAPVDAADLLAPVPTPGQIFGVGANYHDHLAEAGAPVPNLPLVFTKFPSSVTGPYSDIEIPTTSVDYEVELVLVMGRLADRVPAAEAWQYVYGVLIGQDFSARGVQMAQQMSLGKSFRGFAPIGPWVSTLDEIGDPDQLGLTCRINDEVTQSGNTKDMVFSSAEIIALLSSVTPLRPGDLVFTGTCAGVGLFRDPPLYLKAGDVVRSTIDGLGHLRNRCVAPTGVGEYDAVLASLEARRKAPKAAR